MAEVFKPFDDAADEKALKEFRSTTGIVGHVVEGDTYVARLRDGRDVRISLTITLRDYDALSGAATSNEDGLRLIGKLAKRAGNRTPLDGLPIVTVSQLIEDFTRTLNKSLGVGLGK